MTPPDMHNCTESDYFLVDPERDEKAFSMVLGSTASLTALFSTTAPTHQKNESAEFFTIR